MTAKRGVRILTLMLMFMIVQKTSAAIWQDPAAMSLYRGSVPFSSGGALNGFVDYAVYAPGDYSGSVSFSNDRYVYAYQVFNTNSTVGIDYFSVGLPSIADTPDATYDPAKSYSTAGGINPAMSSKLPESVIYLYLTDNISSGERSTTLLFTSSYAPEWGYGYVAGGYAGGAIVELPSPVPEPASFLMIITGTLMAFGLRRKH